MQIKGLQKLTLLDFPGQTACTVFTGGCNFRCPYCHNASLVISPTEIGNITEDEFFAYLRKRQGILDGVAITGGEPLLQADISEFIKKIRELGFRVKLDTNGSFPKKLKELVSEGLVDYVAMDIKNSPDRYSETVGSDKLGFDDVKESIEFLLTAPVDYEFRTTVVKELHTEEDLKKISECIAGAKRYYLQQFIDSGELIENGWSAYSKAEMEKLKAVVEKQIPNVELRGV